MRPVFAYHEFPNGLRVVCETMPRVNSVATGFLVRAGSRHETPEIHGVSHFLEHMCFKGTPTLSSHEVNVRFDELGSIYNAFTSKDHTVYYGWVPASRTAEQIQLLADMMRPTLPAPDYETERNVILEEIAMSDDNFERHVSSFLHEQVFGNHPLAHEILGEKETIAALPRERLVHYHAHKYRPENMILIAAGDVQPEEVYAVTGRSCGGWERSQNGSPATVAPDPLKAGTRKLVLPQFQQQAIVQIFPSVSQSHPDAETIEAFVSLFGGHNSRCYWNIVQKGICTHAGAAWLAYSDFGIMALYAYGEPDRADEMLDALREEARIVSETGFSAEEVQRVKNQRRTQLALEGETPRSRLSQIIDDLECVGHVRTVGARLAEAEAVTPATISNHLRSFPITGEPLMLSVGPRDWPT